MNSLQPSSQPQYQIPELRSNNTFQPLNSSFNNNAKSNTPDPLISNANRRNSLTPEDRSDLFSVKTTTATNFPSMKSHDFQSHDSKPHSNYAKQDKPYTEFQYKPHKYSNEAKENEGSSFFPPNPFLKDMNLSTQTANFEGINSNSHLKPRENQGFESIPKKNGFNSKYMPISQQQNLSMGQGLNPNQNQAQNSMMNNLPGNYPNITLQNLMRGSEKPFSQMPMNMKNPNGNYKKSMMNVQAELMNYDEDFLPEDCIFLLGEEDNNIASFRENVEKEKAKMTSDIDLVVKDVMNIFEENRLRLLENVDLHYKNYITKYGMFKDLLMEFKNMKLEMPSKKTHPNFNLDLTNTSNTNLIRELEDLRYQNQMSKMFNYITALQREKLSQIINLSKELLQLSTQIPNYYNADAYSTFLKEIKANVANTFAKRMQNLDEFVKSLLPKTESVAFQSAYQTQNMNTSQFQSETLKPMDTLPNPIFASPFPLNNNENSYNPYNNNMNSMKNMNKCGNPMSFNSNFQEELKLLEASSKSPNLTNNLYKQQANPKKDFHKEAAPNFIKSLSVSLDHLACKVSNLPQQISLEFNHLFKTGHEDVLLCLIAVTDDLIAVGSKDNTISLWRLSTREKIGVLEGHKGSICSLAALKTAKNCYLFSGSDHEDGSIIVWDLLDLKNLDDCLVNRLIGHNAAVVALLSLQDGQTIISGSYDKEILIWNIYSGKTIQRLAGHNSSITSLNLPKDQNRFVSASLDNTINVWKLNYKENLGSRSFESGYLERTIKNNTFVCSLNCLSDSRTLVTGSKDGKIKFWNMDSGESERVLTANLGPIVELLLLEGNNNNNESTQNRREVLNNIGTLSCSSKDQNLVFTNAGNGNNGLVDVQGKVFIEYGCGVNPKLQVLRKGDGEMTLVVINQSEREKVFSIWTVKMI